MNEHIQNLLAQKQYGEDVKDEAIVRVLFNGESAVDVAEAMCITSVQTINLWVNACRRKIQEGLITLPSMTIREALTPIPMSIISISALTPPARLTFGILLRSMTTMSL